MKKKNIEKPVGDIIKIPTKFPVGVMLKGDDFSFECEISMAMAGKIIEYVGAERERIAKLEN